MADAIYVCDHTGQGLITYPSIGLVEAGQCTNGTGRWVLLASAVEGRINPYLTANPGVIDARIEAYLASNPPASPTGTVTLQPEEMGAAWGAGFVAAATGLVMIWAARSVLDAISVATK